LAVLGPLGPRLFRAFGELVMRWCSHPPVRNLQPEARVTVSACFFSQPQPGAHGATQKAKSIWGVGCRSVPRAPPARLPSRWVVNRDAGCTLFAEAQLRRALRPMRSEERRVGKECASRRGMRGRM